MVRHFASILVVAGLLFYLPSAVEANTSLRPHAVKDRVTAHVSQTCKPPRYPGLGYFTSLTVTKTGCAAGNKLAIAYYQCRTRTGPTGRCKGGVLGFTCRENRNAISTEIDARVTCRRRNVRVVHTYQQQT